MAAGGRLDDPRLRHLGQYHLRRLSIFRGIPAGSDPSAACLHGRRIIHLQRRYRRPTAGRQAHDPGVTLAPGEMVVPVLS